MDLDACGIKRDGFKLDLNDLRTLQLLEGTIKNSGLSPTVHARIDRVPVAETLGQAPPFAAVLGHVKNGVEHLQVGQTDVAALTR